jgi:hypothetical protein
LPIISLEQRIPATINHVYVSRTEGFITKSGQAKKQKQNSKSDMVKLPLRVVGPSVFKTTHFKICQSLPQT